MNEIITLSAVEQHALRIPVKAELPLNGDTEYTREFFPDLRYRAEQVLVEADTGKIGANSYETALAMGVMDRIAEKVVAIVDSGEGAAYEKELEDRVAGFSTAGCIETQNGVLEQPVSYRRIAEIAGLLIDSSQHSVAIDARRKAVLLGES